MKIRFSILVLGTLWAVTGSAAVLTGVSNPSPPTGVNLTTSGTIDWAIWDYTTSTGSPSLAATNSKSGAPGLFSSIGSGGGSVRGFSGATQTYSYTDGVSPASLSSGQLGYVGHSSLDTFGRGISLYITGNPGQTYEVNVWTTGLNSAGQFSATLNGATPLTLLSRAFGGTSAPSLFTLTFRPDVVTDRLYLTFVLDSDTGPGAHVGIQAVTVSAVPEPTACISLLGGLAVLAIARRPTRTRRWSKCSE